MAPPKPHKTALALETPIQLIHESDPRHGAFDFAEAEAAPDAVAELLEMDPGQMRDSRATMLAKAKEMLDAARRVREIRHKMPSNPRVSFSHNSLQP